MKIIVHLRPGAREEKIEKISEGQYKAWVRAVPENGKANDALIELLAEHFAVAKSSVRIVLGKTAREKLVEIDVIAVEN